jgi:hypothetical protein
MCVSSDPPSASVSGRPSPLTSMLAGRKRGEVGASGTMGA